MEPRKRTLAPRPSPEEFEDYRAYLRAMVAHLKVYGRGFSYRAFAKRAGYASPSALHDVVEGRAELSVSAINKYVKGLSLSKREAEAFEALVLLNRASTDKDRNRYYERLRRNANPANGRAQIEKAQYEVYKHWYALPIREMLSLPDFQEDPEWIAGRIFPPIKPAEARKALKLLVEVGLARRDDEGRLRPADKKLVTSPNVASLAVRNFHRAMLEQTAQTLDGLPREERNVTSLTFSFPKEYYEEFCERIWDFERQLADRIEALSRETEGGATDVFQLNVQLFPLTRKKEES